MKHHCTSPMVFLSDVLLGCDLRTSQTVYNIPRETNYGYDREEVVPYPPARANHASLIPFPYPSFPNTIILAI